MITFATTAAAMRRAEIEVAMGQYEDETKDIEVVEVLKQPTAHLPYSGVNIAWLPGPTVTVILLRISPERISHYSGSFLLL